MRFREPVRPSSPIKTKEIDVVSLVAHRDLGFALGI